LQDKRAKLAGSVLTLVSGEGSKKSPHIFQCSLCLATFERAFEKVQGRGQVSCFTEGCSNSIQFKDARKRANRSDNTFTKVKMLLEESGASVESGYKGWQGRLSIRCKCGNLYEATPSDLLCGKQRATCTKCSLEPWTGENHPNWNPDRASSERKQRKQMRRDVVSSWCRQVLALHDYTCCITGQRGVKLSAHHMDSFGHHPERREEVHNGAAIGRELHKEFHRLYGYGNNTVEQFAAFYQQKTGRSFSEVFDLQQRVWLQTSPPPSG
jgi:hypothetical protein